MSPQCITGTFQAMLLGDVFNTRLDMCHTPYIEMTGQSYLLLVAGACSICSSGSPMGFSTPLMFSTGLALSSLSPIPSWTQTGYL